jgi:cardiolipin synthase
VGADRPLRLEAGSYPEGTVDARAARVFDRLGGFPLQAANSVEILASGEEAIDAMLEAIRGGRREIVLLSYIIDPGRVGERLVEALAERARDGVDVKVLYDRIGSLKLPSSYETALRKAGVQARGCFKPNPFKRRLQLNFRNHRKILVVDGAVGFTGGQNWTDDYVTPRGGRKIFDLHVRVHGPSVAALRRVFLEDWAVVTDTELEDAPPFVPAPGGDLPVRVIPHGPDERIDRLPAILATAIAQARKDVLLVTPYYVPGEALQARLRLAALSGLRVRLLLPRRSDNPLADFAAERQFAGLLNAGAEIWLADGDFLHAKAMIVDRVWSTLGSGNFDQRSFRCNYELNLEVVDAGFAERLERHFDSSFAKAERVDKGAFGRRSLWRRLRSNAANLFEPVL